MAINEKEAEQAVHKLLSAMSVDPERHPDIENTPARVVKMLKEVWAGELVTNAEIARTFGKTFPSNQTGMVVEKDIQCFSYCEHHLALIYNLSISVAYIPHGQVIGLSKIARIADMVCKRLQLQERITKDVLDIMCMLVGPDVAVQVRGEHSCMTARGIKKPQVATVTLETNGSMKEPEKVSQFLRFLEMR